jgi:hypothetical protein
MFFVQRVRGACSGTEWLDREQGESYRRCSYAAGMPPVISHTVPPHFKKKWKDKGYLRGSDPPDPPE